MSKKLMGCPGWLKLSEDRTSFIFLPDRAEIVRRIFEASIAGLGGYTIAKQLNAKKVPPFGPSPKWDQSTIHNMLRNRATIGEHQPKRYRNRKEFPEGDPIPNYYPAVIEESLFQAAQIARQKNLASGRGRKGRLITNLFAGIPTCAYCASPIKFHSNGNAKSLICSRVLDRLGCYRMAWSYRDFENSFLDFVTGHEANWTLAQRERESLAKLVSHVRALPGPDVYDARMGIAITLKATVAELKIASAGLSPVPGKPDARIRRDGPGRFFEIRFRGGSAHTGFPLVKK
jgi:Recombinase